MATVKGSDPSLTFRSIERGAASAQGTSLETNPNGDFAFPVCDVKYAFAKRFVDVTISAFAIVVFSWLFLLVALAVKLSSKGPVIFKQKRVGRGGKLFTCYKFRSMCVDAESKKAKLMHMNELSGPVFKIKHDPRVTPVGRILRKLSLDEIPQFFNVLFGDMSIVGPRPPVPSEVARYNEHQQGRLAVKPGLTCLWQISGRNNIQFDHWIELDLVYIETMTFWNDVQIMFKTIPAVITGRGAH